MPKMTQHLAEVEVVDNIALSASTPALLSIIYTYTLNVQWGNNCIAWA